VVGYYVLIGLAVCVALALAWSWWRTGTFGATVTPARYRKRGSQEAVWTDRHPGTSLDVAERVLHLVCDAFRFAAKDRFLFAPDDKVAEIYGAVYPRRGISLLQFADEMELESLLLDLDREFALDEFPLDKETTIGRIVDAVLERQKLTG